MNNEDILNFQISLVKMIINKTGNGEFPIEFQLSIYDQTNRDIRMKTINNSKIKQTVKTATQKQKKLMDDLNIRYDDDIDIKTASLLIDKKLKDQ